jgi:hypothetical protein
MKVIIYTPKTADEDKKHKTHKHKTQKSHGSFVYTGRLYKALLNIKLVCSKSTEVGLAIQVLKIAFTRNQEKHFDDAVRSVF